MKKLFLFSLVLFVFLLPTHSIANPSLDFNPEVGEEDIELEGSLDDPKTRTPQTEPIQATISSTSLNVTFLADVGNISVEVYTSSGTQVYINNVNTQTQTSLSIDVSAGDVGTYEIRFVNTVGNYMYGAFIID